MSDVYTRYGLPAYALPTPDTASKVASAVLNGQPSKTGITPAAAMQRLQELNAQMRPIVEDNNNNTKNIKWWQEELNNNWFKLTAEQKQQYARNLRQAEERNRQLEKQLAPLQKQYTDMWYAAGLDNKYLPDKGGYDWDKVQDNRLNIQKAQELGLMSLPTTDNLQQWADWLIRNAEIIDPYEKTNPDKYKEVSLFITNILRNKFTKDQLKQIVALLK